MKATFLRVNRKTKPTTMPLNQMTTKGTPKIVLLTLYAKSSTDNLTGAKLKEIRRVLES